MTVTIDGRTLWIVAKSPDGYLYAYVPNTGKWHIHKALEYDYYVDQDYIFTPIDQQEARNLMVQRIGLLDERSRGWLIKEFQDDPNPLETNEIMQ